MGKDVCELIHTLGLIIDRVGQQPAGQESAGQKTNASMRGADERCWYGKRVVSGIELARHRAMPHTDSAPRPKEMKTRFNKKAAAKKLMLWQPSRYWRYNRESMWRKCSRVTSGGNLDAAGFRANGTGRAVLRPV